MHCEDKYEVLIGCAEFLFLSSNFVVRLALLSWGGGVAKPQPPEHVGFNVSSTFCLAKTPSLIEYTIREGVNHIFLW